MVNLSKRVPRIYNGERLDSSIDGAGKNGYPQAKEWSQTLIWYHTQK